LSRAFGDDILRPVSYEDKIWNDEFVLNNDNIILNPHQNNEHPLLAQSYMNKKLYLAGTETSPEYGGYMEGAIQSSIRVAEQL